MVVGLLINISSSPFSPGSTGILKGVHLAELSTVLLFLCQGRWGTTVILWYLQENRNRKLTFILHAACPCGMDTDNTEISSKKNILLIKTLLYFLSVAYFQPVCHRTLHFIQRSNIWSLQSLELEGSGT